MDWIECILVYRRMVGTERSKPSTTRLRLWESQRLRFGVGLVVGFGPVDVESVENQPKSNQVNLQAKIAKPASQF
jgi:hypothetical protein